MNNQKTTDKIHAFRRLLAAFAEVNDTGEIGSISTVPTIDNIEGSYLTIKFSAPSQMRNFTDEFSGEGTSICDRIDFDQCTTVVNIGSLSLEEIQASIAEYREIIEVNSQPV